MRRIVMFNRVTADGYFAGPDDGLDWVIPEPELDRSATAGMPSADTLLLGRRTYEMFAAFWPHALEKGAPHGGGMSPEHRAMARWLNDATKLVFSRTLSRADWSGSRILCELEPRELAQMKNEPGKDIMVLGSGSIVSQLTEHGLIDEYQIVVSPTLIGSGRSLFRDLPARVKLELVEARAYPSGNVMLRYARG